MPYRPSALMHRGLKRQLSKSCSSLHPLPSLSTIIASRTRSGALGRPPALKSGSNTGSSTRWVTSRKNTLCQEAGSSSMLDLRSDRWAPWSRNMSVCVGSVFLNIPKDRAFAGFCLTKNNVILFRSRDFSEWTQYSSFDSTEQFLNNSFNLMETKSLDTLISLSLIHISEPTRRTPISYAV